MGPRPFLPAPATPGAAWSRDGVRPTGSEAPGGCLLTALQASSSGKRELEPEVPESQTSEHDLLPVSCMAIFGTVLGVCHSSLSPSQGSSSLSLNSVSVTVTEGAFKCNSRSCGVAFGCASEIFLLLVLGERIKKPTTHRVSNLIFRAFQSPFQESLPHPRPRSIFSYILFSWELVNSKMVFMQVAEERTKPHHWLTHNWTVLIHSAIYATNSYRASAVVLLSFSALE